MSQTLQGSCHSMICHCYPASLLSCCVILRTIAALIQQTLSAQQCAQKRGVPPYHGLLSARYPNCSHWQGLLLPASTPTQAKKKQLPGPNEDSAKTLNQLDHSTTLSNCQHALRSVSSPPLTLSTSTPFPGSTFQSCQIGLLWCYSGDCQNARGSPFTH